MVEGVLSAQATIAGYLEAQAVNHALLRGIAEGGPLHDRLVATVAESALESVLPYVPIQTGTLYAAQVAIVEEGAGVAWVTTDDLVNPIYGGVASAYGREVHQRKPFYADGAANMPDMQGTVYEQVEVWLLEQVMYA